MKLLRIGNYYTRTAVKNDTQNIYIFADNCYRTSGTKQIPDDSAYAKRFGKKDICHPTTTTALIRGIDNAFPVTTQKGWKKGISSSTFNWTDDDFEEFKKVIDDDFETIKQACKDRKPNVVFFPVGGLLNSPISKLTIDRTPKLYKYIIEKEIELRDFEV